MEIKTCFENNGYRPIQEMHFGKLLIDLKELQQKPPPTNKIT